VEDPEWECKREASKQTWKEIDDYNTMNWLFGLFKGIAFGECIAIAATLLAQLYIVMPSSSIGLMTQFYYWSIRTFGAETMICIWVIIGMILLWAHDCYTSEGIA
jgi:hypothetical protein